MMRPRDGFVTAGLVAAFLGIAGAQALVAPPKQTATGTFAKRFISVMDFGATPEDPNYDNTRAFQDAINLARDQGGGLVSVPVGRFTLTHNIIIPTGVTLVGEGDGPYDPVSLRPADAVQGPTLMPTSVTGPAFIRITGANSGVQDLIITYPTQKKPADPGADQGPVVFPVTILAEQPTKLEGLLLTNSYDGIRVRSGRVYIEHCHIGSYHSDIDIDNAFDVVRVVHTIISLFGNQGYPPFSPLDTWTLSNGTGIKVKKADGLMLDDVLVFGRNVGILFDENPTVDEWAASGHASNVNLDTNVNGMVARATNARVGMVFSNLLAGNYWVNPGQLVWLPTAAPGSPNQARIAITGGSIRMPMPTPPGWVPFRNDTGVPSNLVARNVIGYDIGELRSQGARKFMGSK